MLLVNIDEFAILKIEIMRLIKFSYSPPTEVIMKDENCVILKIDVLFDVFSKVHKKMALNISFDI